ncbi:MAG: pyridoxamine 5'-phosphate oxidase family protein [Chloroflexota bacterium]|nr:pyridoxamine 5'-phosphate oxidase family protein [Chloroflexota bacterium]
MDDRTTGPVAELDRRFSSPDATPAPWAAARDLLATAKVYWLSTVRPDGRPHVTPIAAVWLDEAICFVTGREERKAKNLAANPRCAVTTGCKEFAGLDVVIEGEVVPVGDAARLRRLADNFAAKYGGLFRFVVRDGALYQEGGEGAGLVYEVAQNAVFGFAKGETFGQTRWRFARPSRGADGATAPAIGYDEEDACLDR